jgi:CubicO group peptidase (beta-lactamase class C family)
MAPTAPDLDALLRRTILEPGVAQAATVAVAQWNGQSWSHAFGAMGNVQGVPTSVDTPFDLASVTKPAFALTCARLIERGLLAWHASLADYLPELRSTAAGAASIASLLSHRAGLRPHVELFEPLRAAEPFDRSRAMARAATARRPGLDPTSESPPLYSDLGYLLVGEAVARVTGQPLDSLMDELLAQPLGLELGSSRLWRRRNLEFPTQVAPTEVVPWRGGSLRAVVHDDNAWAFSGHGVSGHAGLFGTARAVLGLGTVMLDSLRGEGLLRSETARELVRARPGGSLRLGFDSKSDLGSMAGTVAGMHTFGHLGFTGTSLWCDPDAMAVTVLLTNRVCPTQNNRRIRVARPQVHDALFRLARQMTPIDQRNTTST